MINVFLSASVPLPSRHRQFFDTADVLAIREAIKALVEIVLPCGRITTGGHPAITPLIAFFVRDGGFTSDRLTIYQSSFFAGRFPEENEEFADIRLVAEAPEGQAASLGRMRHTMLTSQSFDAAVLIGGMEGVIAEAELFATLHPHAPVIPVASTGAAAQAVFDKGNYPSIFASELTYPTLFREYLPI